MHYANGKAAKDGDKVVGKDSRGNPIAGVLVNINANSDTCNGYVIPLSDIYNRPMINISDFNHAEDVVIEKAASTE